jgi:beta-lactam-binding protein with PASTA domain
VDAKRELESLGFEVAVRGEFDGGREVRDQTPQAGQLRPYGSTVRLVLARG